MKKQFMLIKKHLRFKSLPETVTLSVAIFESRTEVVYKDPTVIDIQLLGAGLQTERALKAGLKSPLGWWQQQSCCRFLRAWNFTPVFTFFVGYSGAARRRKMIREQPSRLTVQESNLQAAVRSRGRRRGFIAQLKWVSKNWESGHFSSRADDRILNTTHRKK